jgi:hypothetical protein
MVRTILINEEFNQLIYDVSGQKCVSVLLLGSAGPWGRAGRVWRGGGGLGHTTQFRLILYSRYKIAPPMELHKLIKSASAQRPKHLFTPI